MSLNHDKLKKKLSGLKSGVTGIWLYGFDPWSRFFIVLRQAVLFESRVPKENQEPLTTFSQGSAQVVCVLTKAVSEAPLLF